LAILCNSGVLAIEPSSFNISTITPAGSSPARRAKSTAASVCPALLNTPPSRAFKGNMCPGLPSISGLMLGSTSAFTVLALSEAEIPVVQP